MARTEEARVADVRRLVHAARALRDRRAELVPAIATSTGLTAEGVELALTDHLEVDATDAELRTLVGRAAEVELVSVVLSANVFVGALRAVAVARAAATEVIVRPSRRDPVFARALVREAADPAIRVDEEYEVASQTRGEIHVYGRDETIADVEKRSRVPVRGHGSGMGVAWITADAELTLAAARLARDVVAFDQRGCLSPRVALVEGEGARAEAFAEAIHAELERWEALVPRGPVPSDARAEAGRYVATMTYASRALVGRQHAVGVAPEGAPLVLPPPYRHVHVAACASVDEAASRLLPFAKAITAVGADEVAAAEALASRVAPGVRCAALGAMQRPPLDGPVDLRQR